MKNIKTTGIALILWLGLTGVVDAASKQDLQSSWVDVRSGGLFGEPGGKPHLMLTLRNKTQAAGWVKVRVAAPTPNAECVLVNEIKPGETASYACAQDKIVPDSDYPIFVTTYRDEALTDEAETRQTTMRFSQRDTAAFEEFLAPPALPVTFEDLNSTEKLSMGTALFGGLGRAQGVLVVSESKLRYTLKDKVIEIPVAQIRNVTVRSPGRDAASAWVVVEYSEGDAPRLIAFQGGAYRGGGPRIEEMNKAISYVVKNSQTPPQ
jgi:hypothetical protein